MNYKNFFEQLKDKAKEKGLSVKIEVKNSGQISIFVWSSKYSAGKFITLDDVESVEAINFMEMAAKED